jgi:SAM-dependent methyltransferase
VSRISVNHWKTSVANPALPSLVGQLQVALSGCETILDVGCGTGSPLRFVRRGRLVGLDGFEPAVTEARLLRTHDEYFVGDVRRLDNLFSNRRFDACVALDVIEHLPKEDGWRMLEAMERLAQKRVVLFTPNGFVPQKSKNGDLQEHLSGWTTADFSSRGYKVLGMCGPKSLRGEYHIIRRKPRALWALASLLADYAHSRHHPESAAALLAIKDLTNGVGQ